MAPSCATRRRSLRRAIGWGWWRSASRSQFQNYLGGLWFVIWASLGRAATTTTEAALLRDSLSGVRCAS
jgi:hypothetical protein